MSSIHEALKRAQEERERLRNAAAQERNPKGPQASPVAPAAPSAPPAAGPETGGSGPITLALAGSGTGSVVTPEVPKAPAEASVHPVSQAIRQSPVMPAEASAARVAETIVEDYKSKQRLHLPPAMVVYHDRSGHAAEQYRRVRNTLLADGQGGPRMFVISSAVAGEGKTTTVLNLGLSMVELRSMRVLLVDPQLVNTGLTRVLRAEGGKGLSELLAEEGAAAGAEACVKATPWHHLYVLGAGTACQPGVATERLRKPCARGILRHLRGMFDVVLVDTPASDQGPDASLVGAHGDGLILAIAMHQTTRGQVQRAVRMFESLSLPVRGAVLTRAGR